MMSKKLLKIYKYTLWKVTICIAYSIIFLTTLLFPPVDPAVAISAHLTQQQIIARRQAKQLIDDNFAEKCEIRYLTVIKADIIELSGDPEYFTETELYQITSDYLSGKISYDKLKIILTLRAGGLRSRMTQIALHLAFYIWLYNMSQPEGTNGLQTPQLPNQIKHGIDGISYSKASGSSAKIFNSNSALEMAARSSTQGLRPDEYIVLEGQSIPASDSTINHLLSRHGKLPFRINDPVPLDPGQELPEPASTDWDEDLFRTRINHHNRRTARQNLHQFYDPDSTPNIVIYRGVSTRTSSNGTFYYDPLTESDIITGIPKTNPGSNQPELVRAQTVDSIQFKIFRDNGCTYFH